MKNEDTADEEPTEMLPAVHEPADEADPVDEQPPVRSRRARSVALTAAGTVAGIAAALVLHPGGRTALPTAASSEGASPAVSVSAGASLSDVPVAGGPAVVGGVGSAKAGATTTAGRRGASPSATPSVAATQSATAVGGLPSLSPAPVPSASSTTGGPGSPKPTASATTSASAGGPTSAPTTTAPDPSPSATTGQW